MKIILSLITMLLLEIGYSATICIGNSYTQPVNSACFANCSSPASGVTWFVVYSGSYTISNPSSIAGNYTGNQALTTLTSELCQNISITFTSGSGSASINAVAPCGSRNESHTIVSKPTVPSGGTITNSIVSGNCIDLTAQGRNCSTGLIMWCVNTGVCSVLTNPLSFCPTSTTVVYSFCHDAASTGCTDSDYVKDSIIVNQTTSVEVKNKLERIVVYPNPANDILFISNVIENISVMIIDVTGKTIKSDRTQSNSAFINISELKEGIYFLQFNKNGVSYTKKFIKQ